MRFHFYFVKAYFYILNCSYYFIQLLVCVFLIFIKEIHFTLMSFSVFILAILKSLPYISGKFPFSGDIAIKELFSGRGNCLDYSHLCFPEGTWPSGVMKFMTFLGVAV